MLNVRFTVENVIGLSFLLQSPRESANYTLRAVVADRNESGKISGDLMPLADALDATSAIRVVSVIRDSGTFSYNTVGAIVMTRSHTETVGDIVHAVLDVLQERYDSPVTINSQNPTDND